MKRVRLLDPWVFYFGVEPEELAAIYQSRDLYLNPSYGEGFGIPIIEAQACGLPVVAARNSSMPELCYHGYLAECKPFMTPYYTWWGMPQTKSLIAEIKRAMLADAIPGQSQSGMLDWVSTFEDDAVYEDYWEPFIKRIEEELK